MGTTDQATSVVHGYDAFRAGNFAALVELIADDCVWHITGRNPLAGMYRGRDAIVGLMARTVELSGGTIEVDVVDITMSDNHIVVLQRTRATRAGKTLDNRTAIVMAVRDGLLVEAWDYFENQYQRDEFWSD